MPLHHVRLERFRLIEQASLELAAGTNLFVGSNAQGKTTILEAIGYLATGRSFRATRDRECIAWSAPRETNFASVEGRYTTGASSHDIRLIIAPRTKSVWVDGKALRTLTEMWGQLRAVFFAPADLRILQGQPTLRRNVMDSLLGQTNPAYLRILGAYNKALLNRNKLLRGRVPTSDKQYAAFESSMAENAAKIILQRTGLAGRLSELARPAMMSLADGTETLELGYEPGFAREHQAALAEAGTPAELADRLRAYWAGARATDYERSMTMAGPHRDDLRFEINRTDARTYASQGQIRSAVLSLRLAELDYLGSDGRTPLLLLDDILGELDLGRSKRFLRLVAEKGVQTIVTATDASAVAAVLHVDKRFLVTQGAVASQ